MELGLKGKVAIITGGSDGIGKAAALSMAKEGARVAIAARTASKLEAAASDIRAEAKGGDVMAVPTDVRDEAQVKRMVDEVVKRWGRVDILVNNAGTSSAKKFEELTDEVFGEDFQLKVYGAIYCIRAVLPHLKRAKGGSIINITTPGGKASAPGSNPTSMARAAGISMTKSLSKEFAADNIRVNTVCIGLIKSGQHRTRWEARNKQDASYTLDRHWAEMGKTVPLGRVGESAEAGDVIAFLASDRAAYVSGASVNIDGGVSPVV
jgi:NAD(P)-dependent dehydrogenase (short-subunit alcohol dehydrogenase family)